MAKKSIQTRIFLGSVMIAVLAGLFVLDWFVGNGLIIKIVLAAISIPAILEITNLAYQHECKPLTPIMLIGTILLIFLPFKSIEITAILLFTIVAAQMFRKETKGAFTNIAWSLFGIIYIGLFLSFITSIRIDHGIGPVILLVAATKASDIGAYFTGMALGKHKLIPWLSPGKTIEGLFGAVIFSIVVTISICKSGIIKYDSVPADLNLPLLILLGMGFALVGHLGDLAESLLKRDAGAKDSAHLVPEFGGVLDLIDSILPNGFMLYLILKYVA